MVMNDKIFKILLSISIGLVIGLIIFFLLWKNGVFVLKAVRIYHNHYVTKKEILKCTKFNFSENIFKIDTKKIEQQIRRIPMVEEVTVSRIFPSNLKISVKEHKLIAGIAGSEVAALTEKGDLICKFNPEAIYDLPIITGIHFLTDSLGQRQPLQPNLMNGAFHILKAMKQKDALLFSEISEINFNKNIGMMFNLKKNNIPVLIGNDNLVNKLNCFSAVFKELVNKNALNNILAFDVRYEGQVVVKQK